VPAVEAASTFVQPAVVRPMKQLPPYGLSILQVYCALASRGKMSSAVTVKTGNPRTATDRFTVVPLFARQLLGLFESDRRKDYGEHSVPKT
jgi:hypothetical protein